MTPPTLSKNDDDRPADLGMIVNQEMKDEILSQAYDHLIDCLLERQDLHGAASIGELAMTSPSGLSSWKLYQLLELLVQSKHHELALRLVSQSSSTTHPLSLPLRCWTSVLQCCVDQRDVERSITCVDILHRHQVPIAGSTFVQLGRLLPQVQAPAKVAKMLLDQIRGGCCTSEQRHEILECVFETLVRSHAYGELMTLYEAQESPGCPRLLSWALTSLKNLGKIDEILHIVERENPQLDALLPVGVEALMLALAKGRPPNPLKIIELYVATLEHSSGNDDVMTDLSVDCVIRALAITHRPQDAYELLNTRVQVSFPTQLLVLRSLVKEKPSPDVHRISALVRRIVSPDTRRMLLSVKHARILVDACAMMPKSEHVMRDLAQRLPKSNQQLYPRELVAMVETQ